MLNAMSQGNDGSLSTIHANSSLEVFNRIGTYAIQSRERLPLEATTMLIAGALDFVVFLRKRNDHADGRHPDARRREHPRGRRPRRAGALERGVRPRPGRPRRRPRPDLLRRRARASTATSRSSTGSGSDGRAVPRRRSPPRSAPVVGLGCLLAVLAVLRRGDPAPPVDGPGTASPQPGHVDGCAAGCSWPGSLAGVATLAGRHAWVVLAVAVGLLVGFWDRIFGGARHERAAIIRMEGLAAGSRRCATRSPAPSGSSRRSRRPRSTPRPRSVRRSTCWSTACGCASRCPTR